MLLLNECKTFDTVDSAIAQPINWQLNSGATEAPKRRAGALFG